MQHIYDISERSSVSYYGRSKFVLKIKISNNQARQCVVDSFGSDLIRRSQQLQYLNLICRISNFRAKFSFYLFNIYLYTLHCW